MCNVLKYNIWFVKNVSETGSPKLLSSSNYLLQISTKETNSSKPEALTLFSKTTDRFKTESINLLHWTEFPSFKSHSLKGFKCIQNNVHQIMQIIWTYLFFLKGFVVPITFSRIRNLLFCHASGNCWECFAVTK